MVKKRWVHGNEKLEIVRIHIQWNPSIMNTIGNQNFVRYSQLRSFWYISSRCGIPNWAAWLRFHNFPLLYAGRESYAEASTMRQRESKLLTTAAMVDNLAEKVVECPLNRGH